MADQLSAFLPIARFVGLVFPTLYAGVTSQYSYLFVPPIVDHAPNQKVMAKQWLQGYQLGPLWVPPLVMPGTASNIFLALNATDPTKRLLYCLAAAGIFSIVPITFLYMEPGINGACKWKAQSLLKDEGMDLVDTSVWVPSAHRHGGTTASRRWAERANMKELILFWTYVNNFRWALGGLSAMASGWATFSQMGT